MIVSTKKTRFFLYILSAISVCIILSSDVLGQRESNIIVSEDESCEQNALNFDIILTQAKEYHGSEMIILIARLGDGENSHKYNKRRLEVVKAGISAYDRFPAEKIITAQGERVKGKGLVEVYVGGRLFAVFKARRKENIKSRNDKKCQV